MSAGDDGLLSHVRMKRNLEKKREEVRAEKFRKKRECPGCGQKVPKEDLEGEGAVYGLCRELRRRRAERAAAAEAERRRLAQATYPEGVRVVEGGGGEG